MIMYKNTPIPKNTAAKIYAAASLIVGFALFLSTGVIDYRFPWLAQMIGIIFLGFSIYVASVYLLRRYTFSVEESEKTGALGGKEPSYLFRITELKSTKQLTVCLVDVDDIKLCRTVTAKNRKTVNAERKAYKRYRYDTQFIAPRRLELQIHIDGEDISVLVTYDESLAIALKQCGVRVE